MPSCGCSTAVSAGVQEQRRLGTEPSEFDEAPDETTEQDIEAVVWVRGLTRALGARTQCGYCPQCTYALRLLYISFLDVNNYRCRFLTLLSVHCLRFFCSEQVGAHQVREEHHVQEPAHVHAV